MLIRTRDELVPVMRTCPLQAAAATDPSKLVVTLWDTPITSALRDAFAAGPATVERFVAGAHAMYCRMPDGISVSVPYENAARTIGDRTTARNWSAMPQLKHLESIT